jgi:hypothetical protein
LYEGEQYKVLGLHDIIKKQYSKEKDIVYLSNPIPARVADFYGDFVSGDLEKMVIAGDSGKPEVDDFVDETVYENDLKEKMTDIGTRQSEFGYVPLLGWVDEDDIYHIDEIPQDQYFPQGDGSVVIATYKLNPAPMFDKELLLLTKHYELVNGKVLITREAWKCDGKGIVQSVYSLEAMAAIIGRPLVPTETLEIDDLPIRQIDNTHRSREGYGKSDYCDIVPQLAEINERTTQIATQLLKNLDAKMQLPASMFDEDGKVKYFDSVAIESKEDPDAKYITNANPLITDAQEHILGQIKMISFSTAVPMFEILKSTMPERVESLRIQMFQAIRRTNRKRAKISRAINDMFRIGFKLKGIEYDEDITLKFSDVLPSDELNEANTESIKITSGLTSRKSAIMRLEGYTPEEADEEMKQITSEDKIAGVDIQNPPVLV